MGKKVNCIYGRISKEAAFSTETCRTCKQEGSNGSVKTLKGRKEEREGRLNQTPSKRKEILDVHVERKGEVKGNC